MSRRVLRSAALLSALCLASPVLAADWMEPIEFDDQDWCGSDDLRGAFLTEPKDWSGLGDECDPLTFEVGMRYWYSWGAHGMTLLGDDYSSNDTSHVLEGHFRIDDHSSDVYLKGVAGYAAIINNNYTTPNVAAGTSQSGRIKYLAADLGYAPFGEEGTMFGGFVGYQYWNDSPDMGRENYIGGSMPNDINYNMFKVGVAGRLDFGGYGDITAEVAAIPFAPVWGQYGAFYVDPGLGIGTATSTATLGGYLWGASGEVMARFHPLENWTVGLGGRAWYLNGQADVNFSTNQGGGTNWITKTTHFSTLRYGLLGEISYKF
jgi:hypothetical protein